MERPGHAELPGRARLSAHLARARERYKTTGRDFAYLICEVDDLHTIERRFGGTVADEFVQEIALRLLDAVREDDVVARTTSTQFAVLATETNASRASWLMHSLVEIVEGLVAMTDPPFWASVTVGAASTSTVPAHAVVAAAATALEEAQRGGRGRAHLFDPAIETGATRVRPQDRPGLGHPEVAPDSRLAYQPVVDLATNNVIGAQTLLQPFMGDGAITARGWGSGAEHSATLGRLDDRVLRQACLEAVEWRRTLGVGIPPGQLTEDLLDKVGIALQASGLKPSCLAIEVTESAIGDSARATRVLHGLAGIGVHVVLDDFGNGTRLMARLHDLPLHAVKLDRVFVDMLGTGKDDIAMASAMLKLALSLNLPVVAKHVETSSQAHLLRELGCSYGQGRLWRASVRADELLTSATEIERYAIPTFDPNPTRGHNAEPDAAVRTSILAMHRRGASPASIAAALNQDSVPPPTGTRWHQFTVARLIATVSDPSSPQSSPLFACGRFHRVVGRNRIRSP